MRFDLQAPDPENIRPMQPLHRDRGPEANLRFVLKTLEAEGGTGAFVAYKRSGQRLLRKLKAQLPTDKYRVELVFGDGDSEFESRRFRYRRYMTVMIVRRASDPPPDPIAPEPSQ